MKFPKYPSKSHSSGAARIRITFGGRARDYYLGKFGSPESKAEYARLMRQFATDPVKIATPKSLRVTISGLIALWSQDPKERQGNEGEQVLAALRPLDRLYGPTLAEEFDCSTLETLRDAMVSCSWMNAAELAERVKRKKLPGWSRNHVNHQITRVRKLFRWAERKGHVPKGMWEHLRTLPALDKKSGARKNPKRKPVEESVIEATIPHMSPMVAAMVRVQVATGMRPSELVKMRAGDIDRPGEVWMYRLEEFKTDHLDDADEWQTVFLGPESQKAMLPWLDAAAKLGPDTFLWRPTTKPACISTSGYYQAITDACVRASVPKWVPYQIRHTARRRITREAGDDAARAVLRHRTMQSTQAYAAQQDLKVAAEIAKKCG